MFLYILRELLMLAESHFGWALFAGTQNDHKPIKGYFGHGSGRLIKLKHIKLGKPDTQEHYPSKGEGTPATP